MPTLSDLSETRELTKYCENRYLNFCKVRAITKSGKLSLGKWYNCREEFYKTWRRKALICFGVTHPRRFLNFIRITEERLAILSGEKIPPTKVGRTNCKGIVWIEVSEWWRATPIRRSFFTEFIRAGANYDRPLKDHERTKLQHQLGYQNPFSEKLDYWSAMWSRPHFKQTAPAVLRFLDGYTHYTGPAGQWFAVMFWNNNPYGDVTSARPVCGESLEKMLVKPPPADGDQAK